MTTSEQALRAARSASAQTTYLALNAENILLRDEISRLQAKFDIAHAALGVAVDECERLTGEKDAAVKERDEWHRLKFDAAREALRLTKQLERTQPVVDAAVIFHAEQFATGLRAPLAAWDELFDQVTAFLAVTK